MMMARVNLPQVTNVAGLGSPFEQLRSKVFAALFFCLRDEPLATGSPEVKKKAFSPLQ
jgi:hypothetical protein